MSDIVISGSGLFIPPFTITNDELVEAYNAYANRFNEEHADAIASGETEALPLSSSEFIEKASGIKARYAMYKDGIVNPDIMHPVFPMTQEGATPEMVTMGVAAAREAMEQAGMSGTRWSSVLGQKIADA
ncbi:MAG: beta-ketoacyl-ACP synthase III, partial [Gammaproteobacteria bacterium]|nr:beta-ketoacyl-ACP synthase III [Gammaproteobacteria bacterium]